MDMLQENRRKAVEQRISASFDFPVLFTRGLFQPENSLLAQVCRRLENDRRHRVLVFLDRGVAEAIPDLPERIQEWFAEREGELELVAPPQTVPGGEQAKNEPRRVLEVVRTAMEHRLCRHSFVLAIGGGAVLDMVGFGGALFHRGLRLIRVPTTVLAQNDAGVGVKNGVNLDGVKNALGTFAPPFAVIDDFEFLRSLPQPDWIGGVAEAFKVAIIKDRKFFDYLRQHAAGLRDRDEAAMEETVQRCAVLHLDHIRSGGDPFEMGQARPLDFGHWSAHRLEIMSGYRVRHGQAVAAGLALDSVYAHLQGWLDGEELEAILAGLETCGLALWYPEYDRRDARGALEILRGLAEFREHLGGELTVTFPRGIGLRQEVHEIDLALMEQALERVRLRAGN